MATMLLLSGVVIDAVSYSAPVVITDLDTVTVTDLLRQGYGTVDARSVILALGGGARQFSHAAQRAHRTVSGRSGGSAVFTPVAGSFSESSRTVFLTSNATIDAVSYTAPAVIEVDRATAVDLVSSSLGSFDQKSISQAVSAGVAQYRHHVEAGRRLVSGAQSSSGGSAPVAPTAPVFYDFVAGEGWGTGTAIPIANPSLNGFTALIDTGGSGTASAVKVNTTTGMMSGTSANSGVHTAKSITSGDGWVRYTVGSGAPTFELHRNMVGGTDSFSGIRIVMSAMPTTGGTGVWRKVVSGTPTNTPFQTFGTIQQGDVFGFVTDSTNNRLIPYFNGRVITATTTIPSGGFDMTRMTLTGQHGILGSSASSCVDEMEFGDSTMGMLRLYQPTRVAQREANGDLIFTAEGVYTKADPASLKYNITTSAKVAVQTAQPLSSAVIGSGAFSGVTTAFTPAAATSYILTVYRDDATGANGTIIKSHGPWVLPGEVDVAYGQSNMANSYATITTTSYTPPASSYYIDVATTPSGLSNPVEGDAVVRAMGTNVGPTQALSTLSAGYSGIPTCLIQAGVGSTSIEQRSPGGDHEAWWYAMLAGIKMAGRRLRYCHWKDGESNVGSSTTYASTFFADMALLDSFNGRNMVYLMSPVGSLGGDTTTQSGWEAMRRLQVGMALDSRANGRLVISSYCMDLQHDGNNPALHYTGDSYAIFWRRQMMMRLYLDGKSAYHLLGPSIASVAKVDNNNVDVTFNKNTLDSLSPQNTAVNSDFSGGLRFSSTSAAIINGGRGDITSITNCVQQSTTTTQEVWRFTLGTAVPGSIYVSGPGGSDPFNPTGNTTIKANLRTQASIMSGLKTGEDWVAVQPYYDFTSGNDYLIAA